MITINKYYLDYFIQNWQIKALNIMEKLNLKYDLHA